jgi:thymidine kinase
LIVIVAALDGTFQRKPFGNILNLIPLAETITKLSAICLACGKEAAFTQRTISSHEIELIGGSEMYKPVCR